MSKCHKFINTQVTKKEEGAYSFKNGDGLKACISATQADQTIALKLIKERLPNRYTAL